jgi:DNA-binding NarL/FixJ family response regulator
MNRALRVLLVDDHALVRQGLKALLESSGMCVVGEAKDGQDAVQKAVELSPDVVVIDLTMPGMNGTEAIPRIRQRLATVKVVVLTANDAPEYVRAALVAGANGYVLKEDSHEDLVSAINTTVDGKTFLSPGVCGDVVSGFLSIGPESTGGHSLEPISPGAHELTGREREVLKLTAEGKSNKQMADYLHLSVKTVEKHRASAMKRIGAKGVADVTAYAIRNGLVSA